MGGALEGRRCEGAAGRGCGLGASSPEGGEGVISCPSQNSELKMASENEFAKTVAEVKEKFT